MGITQCAEICPFKTASGWCGLTGCIRRHTTTEISANPVLVIPDDYVKVVRCKDCKYAHMTYDGEVKYCDRISMPDDEGDYGYALYLPGDWFCADGERRESE